MKIRLAFYCLAVRSWLPCPRREKGRIMEQIRANTDRFLAENPGASFRQVQDHFGSPREIAAAYVDDLESQELLKKLRLRRRILAIVLGVAAVVLATWLAVIAWATHEASNYFEGYIESSIDQGETFLIEP